MAFMSKIYQEYLEIFVGCIFVIASIYFHDWLEKNTGFNTITKRFAVLAIYSMYFSVSGKLIVVTLANWFATIFGAYNTFKGTPN